MLNSITRGIAKVFGTKADKDLKVLMPYVALVNTEHKKLSNISDEQLRGKTRELKDEINARLKFTDDKISDLQKNVDENPDLDINEKESLFAQIDSLEESRDVELEKVLIELLPRAFAVVKETARRFTENHKLTVQATIEDKQLAANRPHI